MYTIMSILVCIIMRGSLYASNSCGKSVNITELRKNPAKYFIDQPVAVLSNNRPAGYLLSASAFEALMDMLAEQEEKKPIKARFRPSAARLEEITRRAENILMI